MQRAVRFATDSAASPNEQDLLGAELAPNAAAREQRRERIDNHIDDRGDNPRVRRPRSPPPPQRERSARLAGKRVRVHNTVATNDFEVQENTLELVIDERGVGYTFI